MIPLYRSTRIAHEAEFLVETDRSVVFRTDPQRHPDATLLFLRFLFEKLDYVEGVGIRRSRYLFPDESFDYPYRVDHQELPAKAGAFWEFDRTQGT